MDATKFDDVFMGILQHCEQVEPFLDAIFSFLSRKTDFFRVMHNRDDKMGFPPGVAEKIVMRVRQLVHWEVSLHMYGGLGINISTTKGRESRAPS